MKKVFRKIKKLMIIFLAVIICPLLITYLRLNHNNDKKPYTKTEEVEDMLPELLSQDLTGDEELELMKAMAIIERTRVKKELEEGKTSASILSEEVTEIWKENKVSDVEDLEEAAQATYGQVITYDESYIDPEYHYLSAGQTRCMKDAFGKEEYPYLTSVTSQMDIQENDYIQVFYYKKNEFQMICENQWQVSGETFEIIATDSGEYVTTIRIDEKELTGEEFRIGMGIPSSAFTISQVDDYIRIVTKGVGHGFGLSIYGGNEMAKMGATYKSILEYYYPGISIKSE